MVLKPPRNVETVLHFAGQRFAVHVLAEGQNVHCAKDDLGRAPVFQRRQLRAPIALDLRRESVRVFGKSNERRVLL